MRHSSRHHSIQKWKGRDTPFVQVAYRLVWKQQWIDVQMQIVVEKKCMNLWNDGYFLTKVTWKSSSDQIQYFRDKEYKV